MFFFNASLDDGKTESVEEKKRLGDISPVAHSRRSDHPTHKISLRATHVIFTKRVQMVMRGSPKVGRPFGRNIRPLPPWKPDNTLLHQRAAGRVAVDCFQVELHTLSARSDNLFLPAINPAMMPKSLLFHHPSIPTKTCRTVLNPQDVFSLGSCGFFIYIPPSR